MNRSERLNNIHIQFDSCAGEFCNKTGGKDCNIESIYKGEELPQNLQYRVAKINYDSFALAFLFTAHGSFGLVNSILECFIYTDKTDEAMAIPLQFVCDFCNADISTPLSIPLISSEKCMSEAFNCLSTVVSDLWEDIGAISLDSYRSEKLSSFFIEELYGLYGMDDIDEVWLSQSDYKFLTLRFTADPFLNYIKGNTQKAIKQLSKQKHLTGYEKRSLRLWKNGAVLGEDILPSIRANAATYNNNGVQKSSFKEFISLFLCWIVMTPFVSLIYAALYLLLMHLEGRSSVYLMGPIYNLPFCAFLGFLTSIISSYFLRSFAFRLLFKKDYDRFSELDSMNNGGGADKFMNVFLWIAVLASVIGCILFTKFNVNFKKDGFIDNSKFFSVKGTFYEYSDIDRVYYRENRTNSFGDIIDFPSYVLVLSDGREIDFFELDEIPNYETELFDHLKKMGVRIEK